jgi:hypothetical protein
MVGYPWDPQTHRPTSHMDISSDPTLVGTPNKMKHSVICAMLVASSCALSPSLHNHGLQTAQISRMWTGRVSTVHMSKEGQTRRKMEGPFDFSAIFAGITEGIKAATGQNSSLLNVSAHALHVQHVRAHQASAACLLHLAKPCAPQDADVFDYRDMKNFKDSASDDKAGGQSDAIDG